jgi:hypothetical protein
MRIIARVQEVSDKFPGDFSSRSEITRKISGSPPEKWWYRAHVMRLPTLSFRAKARSAVDPE